MSNTPTFSLQDNFPRLPIPSLKESCSLYLHSLLPLQTPVEHEKSKAIIYDFMNSPLAAKLQQKLVDIDRTSPANWLDELWLRKAYLEGRGSLMLTSNWFTVAMNDPDHPEKLLDDHGRIFPANTFSHFQIRRAATLAYNGANFAEQIENETFPIWNFRGRVHLCMHQYSRMMCMTRIPSHQCDELVQKKSVDVLHIAILACDQVYTLNVFEIIDGKRQKIPVDRIEKALLDIATHASSGTNAQKPVPLMSSWDRENWAAARNHLLSIDSIGNRKSFTAIEDALFVLSLDDYSHGSDSASLGDTGFCGQQNRGKGHNRWFDKTVSLIVENNGMALIMGEHAPLDALTVDHFFTTVLTDSVVEVAGINRDNASKPSWLTDAPAPPGDLLESSSMVEHLTWTTDQVVDTCLELAQAAADNHFDQFKYYNLWFDDFGNNEVRRVAKLPIDPLYQMVLQLTYYRIHSTVTPTYETAQTRLFRNGRTETIRVCSKESKEFVEAFDDPDVCDKETHELLVKSVMAHKKYTIIASTGKGCDRHLMALFLLNKDHRIHDSSGQLVEAPLHPIFTDPIFTQSQTYHMTTSGLEEGDKLMANGFYSAQRRSYGVTYMSSPDVLKFGISTSNDGLTLPARYFGDALRRALHDVMDLCKRVNKITSDSQERSSL